MTERRSGNDRALFSTVLTIEYDLVSAEDGSKHVACVVGEAMDSGDKGSNKALSVGYKYMAFQIFCIPVEGENDDPDATVHEVASSQPKQTPAKGNGGSTDDKAKREAVARAEYTRAESLLRACVDFEGLKDVWENQIKWEILPKGWYPHLQNVEKEMVAEIKKATAPKPSTSAKAETTPPFDDEIPF
jgi:hypothetical protein